MEIEEAIYGKLTNDPATVAALGARVYPGQAPEAVTAPYAVYHRASQRYLMTLTGRLRTNSYSMHLDVWGEDFGSTQEAYHAIRDCLAAFQGDLGNGQIAVKGIFDEGGDDGAEQPIHAEEAGLFRAGLDLSIWYQKGA